MHGIFPLVKKTDAQDPAYRPTFMFELDVRNEQTSSSFRTSHDRFRLAGTATRLD